MKYGRDGKQGINVVIPEGDGRSIEDVQREFRAAFEERLWELVRLLQRPGQVHGERVT